MKYFKSLLPIMLASLIIGACLTGTFLAHSKLAYQGFISKCPTGATICDVGSDGKILDLGYPFAAITQTDYLSGSTVTSSSRQIHSFKLAADWAVYGLLAYGFLSAIHHSKRRKA